jgi:hypothetical protein
MRVLRAPDDALVRTQHMITAMKAYTVAEVPHA